MRKLLLILSTITATVAAAGGFGAGVASSAPAQNGALQRQLAEVRRATAKYHDVALAEADGYINPGPGHCVELPAVGGMGIHFVNPALIFDGGALQATAPEVLLYQPNGDGKLRLVGVEYLVRVRDWHGRTAPDLFGTPFAGPMPEHEPNTTGDHYDQHLWIWSHNPEGLLAAWNPHLRCP